MHLHYTVMAYQTSYKHSCQLHHNKLHPYTCLWKKETLHISVTIIFGIFLIQLIV